MQPVKDCRKTIGKEFSMEKHWKLRYKCTNEKGKNQFVEREMEATSWSEAKPERDKLEREIRNGKYPGESDHTDFGYVEPAAE